jgi:acyl-coenzyme A thioesterase 9
MIVIGPNSQTKRPSNVIPMENTVLNSAMVMQPQNRNRHNFMIFGGYLLKKAFELAFCCAASFSHSRPTFVSLDPSTFENPVPVGSVLYLRAAVSYTDPPALSQEERREKGFTKVQVRVESKVRDVEHGTRKSTGVFDYTFLVPKNIQVMPKTYGEFMIWIDARRRARDMVPVIASRLTQYITRSGEARYGVTE